MARGALGRGVLLISAVCDLSLPRALNVGETARPRGLASGGAQSGTGGGLPRIAVIISGKVSPQFRPRVAADAQNATIVDFMTGEEEEEQHDEGRLAQPQSEPRPWDTFREHVLRPLRRDFQGGVDIFVCTNEVIGVVPDDVTAVFEINLEGPTACQFDRAHACFSKVLERGNEYAYFMKVRPDFVFLSDVEDYSSLRPDCMHTRFQRMWNIAGIQRCHSQLIFSHCQTCNGDRPFDTTSTRLGYIGDDMVFVVPSQLAKSAFMTSKEIEHWSSSDYTIPHRDSWVGKRALEKTTEGRYTKAMIMNQVPMCPLCINGWPKLSVRDWKQHHQTCRNDNSPYDCGHFPASVDDMVELIKTGRVPDIIQGGYRNTTDINNGNSG